MNQLLVATCLEVQCKKQIRRCSHYGENDSDGDGTVTFYCSHYTFRNVAVTVSLPYHGCHSDGDGHGRKREGGEVGTDDGVTRTATNVK